MVNTEIKEALISMQKGISESDPNLITDSLGRLDSLLKEHKREIDPKLKHYLKNRSYQKAMMYIDGESGIPVGRCGSKH